MNVKTLLCVIRFFRMHLNKAEENEFNSMYVVVSVGIGKKNKCGQKSWKPLD